MQALDGKQIDRLRKRMQSEPCLSPLKGDGAETKKVLDEIYAWIDALAASSPEFYRDKLGKWREQLRAARYADWLTSRHA